MPQPKTDWVHDALQKLSIDELTLAIQKMHRTYKSGGKIVSVVRSGRRASIGIKLDNGQLRTIVV